MPFLFLHILCAFCFSQILRYAQERKESVMVVVATNYATAVIATFILFHKECLSGLSMAAPPVMIVAIINGLLYFLHLFIVALAFRSAGVGITTAVMNANVVIPVIISWFLWSEIMTPFRWVAVTLVPIGMWLIRSSTHTLSIQGLRNYLPLFGSFFIAGMINSLHKYVSLFTAEGNREAYQLGLFTVAMVFAVSTTIYQRLSYSKGAIVFGISIGLSNALATFFLLKALKGMPAVMFFPIAGCSLIGLNLVVSCILWKERLSFRQLVGMLLMVLIVILTNS